jgi:hypothetical protein
MHLDPFVLNFAFQKGQDDETSCSTNFFNHLMIGYKPCESRLAWDVFKKFSQDISPATFPTGGLAVVVALSSLLGEIYIKEV